ncbi:MAG: PaaI family thioesterase [Actinomycetota bacterium]
MGAREDRVEEVRGRVERSRFHAWLGLHLEALRDGEAELALEVGPDHVNLMGVLHGGVISSLADAATGIAMLSALDDGWGHLTTSIQVTFLAAGRLGDRVVATGRVVKRGRRFGYAEADVRRSDGTLLARATATFQIQPEREPD